MVLFYLVLINIGSKKSYMVFTIEVYNKFMKYKAGLLLLLSFLVPSSAYASTSNVHVETNSSESHVTVNNSVQSSSNTQVTQNGSTEVNIEQSGNGHSEVTINGKQWKVDGPGEVHEKTSTNSNSNSGTTPTVTPTHEATATPTLKPEKKEVKKSIIQEAISSFLHRLFSFLGLSK